MANLDILRILPTNDVAKECFDELIKQKLNGTLDKHHEQYVVQSGKGLLDRDYRPPKPANSGSEGPEEGQINLGYFRMGFDTHPFHAGIRWVLGKGNDKRGHRRVDILLADPESAHGSLLDQAHLFLHLHPRSGAWLLRASGPTEMDDRVMRTYGSECLYQPQTDIKVCGLRFRIEFCIKNAAQEKRYLAQRDEWLDQSGCETIEMANSGIPFETDTRLRSAFFRTGLGGGSFGIAFQGINPVSGGPVAVKRLCVVDRPSRALALAEIRALEELKGRTGIVRLHEAANLLKEDEPLKGKFPYDIYLVQDLGQDLKHYNWHRENLQSPNFRLHVEVLRQLLEGVLAIHQKGYMHRDITRQNIVYFPAVEAAPLRAALIDFGKVWFKPTDTDTTLAAWENLPPEVVIGKGSRRGTAYDQKIDVWMLALSLAHCWFPVEMRDHNFIHDQKATTEMINSLAARKGIPLVAILMRMLLPDPRFRPGAEELLRDRIFGNEARRADLEELSPEKGQDRQGKRKA